MRLTYLEVQLWFLLSAREKIFVVHEERRVMVHHSIISESSVRLSNEGKTRHKFPDGSVSAGKA